MVGRNRTYPGAENFLPDRLNLKAMEKAAQSCRGCPLYKFATQAVFGEGPERAQLLFIGEQPGNVEDLEGHPFVGPAGKLLDKAFEDAGISRDEAYVTNAVKHFKFIRKGKIRLHQKPNTPEVRACEAWWKSEVQLIQPRVIVCLGATAAQAVFGRTATIKSLRGDFVAHEIEGRSYQVYVTVHPSSILRAPDAVAREQQLKEFVKDLKNIKKFLTSRPKVRILHNVDELELSTTQGEIMRQGKTKSGGRSENQATNSQGRGQNSSGSKSASSKSAKSK